MDPEQLDLCVLTLSFEIVSNGFPTISFEEQHAGDVAMCYYSTANTATLKTSQGLIPFEMYYTLQPTAFYLDGGEGSSGSGYWNANGKLIGIHVCKVNTNERQCVFLSNSALVNPYAVLLIPKDSALSSISEAVVYETVTKYAYEEQVLSKFLGMLETAASQQLVVNKKQIPDCLKIAKDLLEEHQKAHSQFQQGKSMFNQTVLSVLQPFAICMLKIGTAFRLLNKKAFPKKHDVYIIDVGFGIGTDRNTNKPTTMVYVSGDAFSANLLHIYPCGHIETIGRNKEYINWKQLQWQLQMARKSNVQQ